MKGKQDVASSSAKDSLFHGDRTNLPRGIPAIVVTEASDLEVEDIEEETEGKGPRLVMNADGSGSSNNNSGSKEVKAAAKTEKGSMTNLKGSAKKKPHCERSRHLLRPDGGSKCGGVEIGNKNKKRSWNLRNSSSRFRRRSLKFGVLSGLAALWLSCFGLVVLLEPAERGTEARLVACLLGGDVFLLAVVAYREEFRRHAVRRASMALGRRHWLVRAANRTLGRKVGSGFDGKVRRAAKKEGNDVSSASSASQPSQASLKE